MSDGKYITPGDRHIITRIARPDPDSYAVIHYDDRWAFPCSRAWFDEQRPAVGDALFRSVDDHWRVEKPLS